MARPIMKSLVSVFVLFLCAVEAYAQGHQHAAGSHDGEQLGTVSFATSCAPGVQRDFERGVALLHSFWYEESEKQFVAITKADPSCAMAHWGVAMSLYHQLGDRATGQRLTRGIAEARTAATMGAKSGRERGYIDAIAAFYADAETKDHAVRADA